MGRFKYSIYANYLNKNDFKKLDFYVKKFQNKLNSDYYLTSHLVQAGKAERRLLLYNTRSYVDKWYLISCNLSQTHFAIYVNN